MKKKDLESLVLGVKTPTLNRVQIEDLLDSDISSNNVFVSKPQGVAHRGRQSVAHEVAQTSWVAQKGTQKVAQKSVQKVAQNNEIDLVALKEVSTIKDKIAELVDTNERKEYLKSIGISIKVERRGKSYYFYGVKKFQGKKERFYCGRVQ